MEAFATFDYRSSKSSDMGDSSENSSHASSGNAKADSASQPEPSSAVATSEKLEEDASTYYNAAFDKSDSSTQVPEKTSFQLTQSEATFLQNDLHSRFMKWFDVSEKKKEADSKVAKDHGKRLQRMIGYHREHMAALEQCVDESSRVLGEIGRMQGTVDDLLEAVDVLGSGKTEQDRVDDAADIDAFIESCTQDERTAVWLRGRVSESSKALATFEPSAESHCMKLREGQQHCQHRTKMPPGLDILLKKAEAYRRVTELDGGAMPKSTSRADLFKTCADIKKHGKHHH